MICIIRFLYVFLFHLTLTTKAIPFIVSFNWRSPDWPPPETIQHNYFRFEADVFNQQQQNVTHFSVSSDDKCDATDESGVCVCPIFDVHERSLSVCVPCVETNNFTKTPLFLYRSYLSLKQASVSETIILVQQEFATASWSVRSSRYCKDLPDVFGSNVEHSATFQAWGHFFSTEFLRVFLLALVLASIFVVLFVILRLLVACVFIVLEFVRKRKRRTTYIMSPEHISL